MIVRVPISAEDRGVEGDELAIEEAEVVPLEVGPVADEVGVSHEALQLKCHPFRVLKCKCRTG